MKLKYLFASCILGAGLLSSCADEFKDINSSEGDISTPEYPFFIHGMPISIRTDGLFCMVL